MARQPWIAAYHQSVIAQKAGVRDYEAFARDVVRHADRHISFECFPDDVPRCGAGRMIASWARTFMSNYPSRRPGEPLYDAIRTLSATREANVTRSSRPSRSNAPPGARRRAQGISVFAGRLADLA